MAGSDLAAQRRTGSMSGPVPFVVIAARGWPGPGDVPSAEKTRMQDREGKAPVRPQRGTDSADRSIEIVDVRESEAAARGVEHSCAEYLRSRHISVHVADT